MFPLTTPSIVTVAAKGIGTEVMIDPVRLTPDPTNNAYHLGSAFDLTRKKRTQEC
jgi:hypothetical protein